MPPATFAWVIAALLSQQPAPSLTPAVSLDFEVFKAQVQPIFLAKRPGHARCISCHAQGTPMRLQELPPGRAWNDEESRKNFDAVRRMVIPGEPLKSPLLLHALATEAGGDLFHNGGKHFESQDDTEWRTLAAWVRGQR